MRKHVPEQETGAQLEAEIKTDKKKKRKSKKSGSRDDETEYGSTLIDVLRVLSFLFLVSCGLSYLVSGGESFFWSMKVPPKYLRTETWRGMLVRICEQLPSDYLSTHIWWID